MEENSSQNLQDSLWTLSTKLYGLKSYFELFVAKPDPDPRSVKGLAYILDDCCKDLDEISERLEL